MSEQSSAIISKVWGMCSPLRDVFVKFFEAVDLIV